MSSIIATSALAATLGVAMATTLGAQTTAPAKKTTKSFAQTMVEDTLAAHPEADEVSIAVSGAKGCTVIASTDKEDLGGKCEQDETEPMRTGKPYVEKEKDGFDVSVPLHDASGALIGTLGLGFKAKAGRTEAVVIDQAKKIAAELAPRIASKAALIGG